MASDTRKGPIVRAAARTDLPRIGRLGAQLVAEHHDYDARRFLAAKNRTPTDYAAFMSSQLNDPNVIILVADDNSDVIGYAYAAVEDYDYMSLRGPAGVLHDLIVDPANRRRGVGRMLLRAVLEQLKARGTPRVVLTTAEGNDAAIKLFSNTGFRRTMIEMTREMDDTKP